MIAAWYRQNAKDFGWLRATWLLWRIVWGRAFVTASNKLLPKRLECPCCGWQGSRFFDYAEVGYTVRNASCPQCDSHARHRMFFLWLRDQYLIQKRAGKALIFAPEKALAPIWEQATGLRTFKIDLEPSRGVEVLGDIMYLPFVSGFADLVWCHHVLEQVLDDRVALSELRRVLKPGSGDLIISAGESELFETREFGHSEKALSGNRRSYGSDFSERLRAAGFSVELLACDLSEDDRRKYGLHAERFFRCGKN